ncbi:YtpI family protein [Metabacillus litoralis]|uniref:YtpI family protein n=1 Tax=Metabacillus litoralis TaxID=152268 RepID=UPI001CFF38D6|nr:YtpI family protein [Metabacillus litoralis]
MPVFVFFIVVSLAFYVFYKMKAYRSKDTLEKRWFSSKSSIALGIFVASFGANQMFLFRSTLALVIGLIFIVIGVASAWAGYRAYRHYLPQLTKKSQ